MRPALARPPCYVAFSGGRDSSAVLAVAASVARVDGFEAPIPVTERYPDIPAADEDHWQRQVIEHLHLKDWVRLEFHEENDFVGETATDGLLTRGLLWPPAVQIKPNLLRGLSPGTLLTGEGGDEVLGPRRAASWPHLSRRTLVSRRAAFHGVIRSLRPHSIRQRETISSYRSRQLQPWLKPEVYERHLRLLGADMASEPLRWDRSLMWLTRRRNAEAGKRNYQLVAAEHDLDLVEPLLEPQFLSALGRVRHFGFAGRTEAMRVLFGDLLPPAVIERSGKATFNRAFMGEATREFARSWDGSGLDESMVDTDRLRQAWLAETPSALSSMLLQAAWLSVHRAGAPA
jgi:Asparagine synthase